MDINKGLVLDGLDINKPNGSWAVAKNILISEGWKSVKNEYGFDDLDDIEDYIQTFYDDETIYFNAVSSISNDEDIYIFGNIRDGNDLYMTIVKYDDVNDEYSIIMTTYESGLDYIFDHSLVIDIVYTYLPNGDFVLAWCNGISDTAIEPMVLNVDTRNEFVLKNNILVNEELIFLFPRTDHTIVNTEVVQNGNLLPGVYYITARFIFVDDSTSEWCMLSPAVKIGSNPDEITDDAIKIQIDTIRDIPRKGIEIAYIRKHKGIVKAYRYEKLNDIDSTDISSVNRFNVGTGVSLGNRTVRHLNRPRTSRGLTVTKDSDNVFSYVYDYEFVLTETKGYEIDIDSILVKRAFYDKCETVTLNNNKLYLGGVKEQKVDLHYENLAKQIYVEYTESTYDKGDPKNKTFAPGEVYSLYIYFVLKDSGLLSIPYNIPGRDAVLPDDADFLDLEKDTSGTVPSKVAGSIEFSTDLLKQDYKVNGINNISVTLILGEPVNFGVNDYIMFGDDFDIESSTFDDDFLDVIQSYYNTLSLAGKTQNFLFSRVVDGDGKKLIITHDITRIDEDYCYNSGYFYIRIHDGSSNVTDKFTTTNEEINIKRSFLMTGAYTPNYLGISPVTNMMGYWENESSVGGDKHHRFPTLRTLRSNGNSTFGLTSFARLGLKIYNIHIPESFKDKVDYIGVAVAKRTSEDKMYYGESLAFPYFKVSGTSNQYTTFTPELHKHRYTDFQVSPAASTPTYDTHGFALYNFDILNNDLRVNINQFVPAYTINYGSTKILELIGTGDIASYMGYLFNTKNASTAINAEEVVNVDFNAIVPHNTILNYDYDYVSDYGVNTNRSNYNRIARDNNVGSIYNKAGSKHIYCLTEDGKDFSNAYATAPTPSSNLNRVFPDSAATGGESTAGSKTITHTEFKLDFGSIYSYKRNVYVDPNNKDLFVLNKLVSIDDFNGTIEIDNDGDCVISEHLLNLTSDAYIDEDTGTDSDNEKRALSENYAKNSNLCITNRSIYNYLGTSISDVNRVYEKDSIQSKRYFDVLGDLLKTLQYNAYEKPEYGYENDYNSLQDLDVPVYSEVEQIEYNKNKIVFSKLLQNESASIKALKTFLVDNYYILSSDKGGIVNILSENNNLYIQCKKGLLFARIKDYINSDGKNVYLGTGDIFDRVPDEIKFARNRSIHCSHKLSSLMFDFGYAVFDDYNKILVTFNGKELDILSNKNASQFFNKYFDFRLGTYNPLKYQTEGVVLTYDRFNKNLHIICRNNSNPVYFNLSFNYGINNFLSFHDWIGDIHIQHRDNLLSINHNDVSAINTNPLLKYNKLAPVLYAHNNKSKRAIFYNATLYSSYMDIIINGGTPESKLIEVIRWKTEVIDLYNNISMYDKTFTKIMLYNKDQCSDFIDLDNPAHDSDWFDMIQRNINNEWLFNAFSDGRISDLAPFITSIFRTLNTSNVNTSSKDWFNNSVFEGEYVVIRLLYNNEIDGITGTNQHEIVFNSIDVEGKILKR